MMRVKDLPKEAERSERQLVASFFGLDLNDVVVEPQADTYSVLLENNEYAIEKYKEINPFGNITTERGAYSFKQRLLVYWNGEKIQPA
jgi:hypothetical protein